MKLQKILVYPFKLPVLLVKGAIDYYERNEDWWRMATHNTVVARDLKGNPYEGSNPFVDQTPKKPSLLKVLWENLSEQTT